MSTFKLASPDYAHFVQRAKRLIDETTLLMTEIAGRAGFASIRSFNASFREVYRCTPSKLRAGAQRERASGA